MENQHRKITGYRELDEGEIAVMNEIKAAGSGLQDLLVSVDHAGEDIDKRWVAIARTHFQEGLMALTRAVARPTSF